MGRATWWLKDLFGFKRDRPKHETEYSEKKSRCRSGPLVAAINIIPPNITPAEAAWLTSFYNEPDDQQKQHARAVAAATAAAADAALATARAAAKVVRLTTQGRSIREKIAAAKIQTVFRGYLARKALRALKALVKIQSLVRGFLVRKQAAATLQRMHALIRSQEIVRALKAGPQFQARKSSLVSRRLSSSATNDENSKIVEVDIGCWPKSDDLWISQSGYYPESCMSSCVTESTLKTRRQRSQSAPRPRRPEPPLPIRMKAHNLNKSRV